MQIEFQNLILFGLLQFYLGTNWVERDVRVGEREMLVCVRVRVGVCECVCVSERERDRTDWDSRV